MIVLDTNVVSELMRREPSSAVIGWLDGQAPGDLCTTAITVAEVRFGIQRLPRGSRRDLLAQAAAEVFEAFAQEILPFDHVAANAYAVVVSHREQSGRPIGGFDAQIAAICRVRAATIATRNTTDFEGVGIPVVDPWNSVPG